jgi:NADPH:quinone reductase-like Zn-dependent oxidoreductase
LLPSAGSSGEIRLAGVHGAAGNVGAFACSLRTGGGIRVVATCAEADAPYVRDPGADEVLNREGKPFKNVAHDFDAVIDLVGGDVQTRSFGVLKRGGALISAVSPPNKGLATERGIRAAFFLVNVTTERLAAIARMLEAGTIKASVGAVLPFGSARVAHEMLEGLKSRPRGKIVLEVWRSSATTGDAR